MAAVAVGSSAFEMGARIDYWQTAGVIRSNTQQCQDGNGRIYPNTSRSGKNQYVLMSIVDPARFDPVRNARAALR